METGLTCRMHFGWGSTQGVCTSWNAMMGCKLSYGLLFTGSRAPFLQKTPLVLRPQTATRPSATALGRRVMPYSTFAIH